MTVYKEKKFTIKKFSNEIYPYSRQNQKYNDFDAMDALMYWSTHNILWRPGSKFGQNDMNVNWPSIIYKTKRANCVDNSIMGKLFGNAKMINTYIIPFSIYSNSSKLISIDHFTLAFEELYENKAYYHFWNFFDTGRGYISPAVNDFKLLFAYLYNEFAVNTYSPKNGYIKIPDPRIVATLLYPEDIYVIESNVDKTIKQNALFNSMPRFSKWYAHLIHNEEMRNSLMMQKVDPDIIRKSLLHRIKENNIRLPSSKPSDSFLIGQNMMISSQEEVKRLGLSGYNNMLEKRFDEYKEVIDGDPFLKNMMGDMINNLDEVKNNLNIKRD